MESNDAQLREDILRIVGANAGLFAWKTLDMPGIDPDFLCHKLAIFLEGKLIAQKKRKLGEEKRRVVQEET